jgi:hypothetical protein
VNPPSPGASSSAQATADKTARQRTAIWLLAAAVVIAGSLQLTRPGYSVDEEFTVFAARGINASGVPLLPSGLLYDRGILYSYASSIAARVSGAELPAYRAISLICAALIVSSVFALVRRLAGQTPALLASILVMTSVPFWATATTARFYAPFFLLYLATLLSLQSSLLIVALAALSCRLTHELAFTLALIPVLCAIVDRDRRRRWVLSSIAVVAGLVLGQAVLFGFHYFAPTSGDTMVRRFFLWQLLNLFERPGDRQFLIPIVMMVIAWIVAPAHKRIASVIALSLSAMIFSYSLALASNIAPISLALIRAIADEGSRYPLDMFWHIARTTPLTLMLAITGLVVRVAGLGGDWPRSERALHLLWIGWVLWFGVIESGITTNYLLLPVSFMLMAIAVDLYALTVPLIASARRSARAANVLAGLGVIALIALVVHDQWRGADSMSARLDAARPTIHAVEIAEIRDTLQPSDRVVCTDELGCLMLIGRIDRWLALDDYVRERFLVRRGDARATGVYTGVPAAFRPLDVFSPNSDGTLPARILIVDLFKQYPIGNSRSWLPRAIEEDGLHVVPLLETPQLRVLEISLPERAARLR